VAFLTDGRLTAEAKLTSTDGITAGKAPDVTLDLSGTSLTAAGAVSAVPVTTLAQTLKIVCGGLRRHFKFDIDLEWAWRQGVLYTLQARPVTTSL
jgi:hypothetical protein